MLDLNAWIRRAKRGLREERWLYLVAVSSLTVAFLCLGASLLAIVNLDAMAARWGTSARMTVYLKDGADAQDVAQLRVVLEGLPEVMKVEHVTAEAARASFLEDAELSADFEALSADVFPASFEVDLAQGTAAERFQTIAARVGQFRAVDAVETYRGWFGRLESLLAAARGAAGAVAVLVALCVLAVIGNTIRLAVARRRQEIEVMKLCGATDGFVRGPFVLEGAFQGFCAAFASVVVLLVAFLALRGRIDDSLAMLAGVRVSFVDPLWLVALIVGGAVIGALGSAASLRRYLAV